MYYLARDSLRGIRDLIFKLINKSQLLPAGLILFLLIAAVRMPSEDLGDAVQTLLQPSWYHPLGWVIAVFLLLLFLYLLYFQRVTYTGEIERLTAERDKLQRQAGIAPESSEK